MDLEPGTTFAGYRIVRPLGEGGMGAVYLARHPRLPRNDAIKVLGRELSRDPGFRARFEREADIAAGLRHPNIVSVYDRGYEDGQFWIAMQYIEGQDAAELIKAGPNVLTVDRTLGIIENVAKALDLAHQNGLLHRDVKPANILVTPPVDRHSGEMALLTDFGIARSTTGGDQQLTRPGLVVGTAAYAAPEQLAGGAVDHRVDIYALGCTLYEMLTGAKPFRSDTMASAIHAHLTEPPPRPSLSRAGLPPATDRVIARAMAKDPAARYNSCHELAADARRALRPPTPLPPAPPPPPPTLSTPAPFFAAAPPPPPPPQKSKRGLVVGAIATVAVLIAAGIGIAVVKSNSGSGASGTTTSSTSSTSSTTRTSKTSSSRTSSSRTSTSRTAPAGRVVTSSDGSFSVELPTDWQAKPPDELLTLVSTDGSANILVAPNTGVGAGETLQQSAEISAQQVTDLLNGVIDSGGIEATTVDGEPARRYTYNLPVGDQIPRPVRGRQLFVRHQGVEYVVTFTGTPEEFNLAVADYEAIIDSWRWAS